MGMHVPWSPSPRRREAIHQERRSSSCGFMPERAVRCRNLMNQLMSKSRIENRFGAFDKQVRVPSSLSYPHHYIAFRCWSWPAGGTGPSPPHPRAMAPRR